MSGQGGPETRLDDCGCCATPVGTPLAVSNRPGLSAVAYRVGTFASFRRSMLDRIAALPPETHGPGGPGDPLPAGVDPRPLRKLRTRRSDDYAVTLLELWAAVADVLTFYQERIANEAFLRTATQRESVLRLARLIDYQLGPGVAATTFLAFTTEKGAVVKVPVGLKVQSVPGQEEKPQKFETLQAVVADHRLNRLRLVSAPTDFDPLPAGLTEARLAPGNAGAAIAASLAEGDEFIFFQHGDDADVEEKTVTGVHIEDELVRLTWSPKTKAAWDVAASRAFKFTRTFRVFGHNAPLSHMVPIVDSNVAGGIKWTLTTLDDPGDFEVNVNPLPLDGRYDDVRVGSQLLVSVPGAAKTLVEVKAVGQGQVSFGAMTDTVTVVTTDPAVPAADRRKVLVYELAGPRIEFWGRHYTSPVTGPVVRVPVHLTTPGDKVFVGRKVEKGELRGGAAIKPDEIEKGRTVLLADAASGPVKATVESVALSADVAGQHYLEITLEAGSAPFSLSTATAVLLGNVAPASHGETVKGEVLGDGDAAAAFQRFALKKKPVTFVPGGGDAGPRNTLRVLVDRVLWDEVPSLLEAGPTDPVYTTRVADDGTMLVQFGDGVHGARPATGRQNVAAEYRTGSGLAGRVRAGALSNLLDRPIGLKSASNPAAASGGADPQTLDAARRNAPATVRTFGRAISLRDFEDLILSSGEVAKAKATWVWTGESRTVHLTVADQGGATFPPEALEALYQGMTARRDPNHTLLIDNYVPVPVVVTAKVVAHDAFAADDVEAAVRAALEAALAFEAVEFGAALHLSDVYRVLQGVPGVKWVDVDKLQFKDPAAQAPHGATADALQPRLRIFPARPAGPPNKGVLPAEQARLEDAALDFILSVSGGTGG